VNYRHQFHAGNFADVMKHVMLGQLIRALQRKEKGLFVLDTHAGRGSYDLTAAATGLTLQRTPEHPEGIGRLMAEGGGRRTEGNAERPTLNAERSRDGSSDPSSSPISELPAPISQLPASVVDYLDAVRAFDRARGNLGEALRFYPGSPWIARRLLRPQDRLALCELHEDEILALRAAFAGEARTAVHELDGYTGLRAMLPPPEKRALVLIDPPYEAQDEWARLGSGLAEALRRFPSGTYAIWYPLTGRARLDAFAAELLALRPPPTLVAELEIAGESSGLRMRGCGLVILNPPWQFDQEAKPVLEWLAPILAQGEGARASMHWLVPE
jgi:23S rRNA (adenine2030-N6)-methyltransferase